MPQLPKHHLAQTIRLRLSGDLLERYIEAYYLPRTEKPPILRAHK